MTNRSWHAEITGPYPGWPWWRYRVAYHQGVATLTPGDFARTLDGAERKANRRLRSLEANRAATQRIRRVINP